MNSKSIATKSGLAYCDPKEARGSTALYQPSKFPANAGPLYFGCLGNAAVYKAVALRVKVLGDKLDQQTCDCRN